MCRVSLARWFALKLPSWATRWKAVAVDRSGVAGRHVIARQPRMFSRELPQLPLHFSTMLSHNTRSGSYQARV